MLRRLLTWSIASGVMVCAGAMVSACSVTPVAVSVGGASISTSDVNTELSSWVNSAPGGCVLTLENQGLTSTDAGGSGGSGTYSMTAATLLVDDDVDQLVTQQYAASKGIVVTSGQLAAARSNLESTLDGEIAAATQNSAENGLVASCVQPDGQPYSGAQLLESIPSGMADERVQDEAVGEQLLARGADLSPKAVATYYLANLSLFTLDCLSAIVTASQTSAQQLMSQLAAGASFSALAKAHSIDPKSAPQGGALGCNFAESQILQTLDIRSAPVGSPIGPVEDTSTGQWAIYEVTDQVVEPPSTAAPLVRRELLQTTANVTRVDAELKAFARRTSVYVNPQYGSWRGLAVVPPTAPPAQYLLAASLGTSVESNVPGSRLQLNGATQG